MLDNLPVAGDRIEIPGSGAFIFDQDAVFSFSWICDSISRDYKLPEGVYLNIRMLSEADASIKDLRWSLIFFAWFGGAICVGVQSGGQFYLARGIRKEQQVLLVFFQTRGYKWVGIGPDEWNYKKLTLLTFSTDEIQEMCLRLSGKYLELSISEPAHTGLICEVPIIS